MVHAAFTVCTAVSTVAEIAVLAVVLAANAPYSGCEAPLVRWVAAVEAVQLVGLWNAARSLRHKVRVRDARAEPPDRSLAAALARAGVPLLARFALMWVGAGLLGACAVTPRFPLLAVCVYVLASYGVGFTALVVVLCVSVCLAVSAVNVQDGGAQTPFDFFVRAGLLNPATDADLERVPALDCTAELLQTLPAEGCSICLEPFAAGQRLRKTLCAHVFHRTCLDRWLRVNRVCPLCKRDVTRPLVEHE